VGCEVIAALAAGDPALGARPILRQYSNRTLDVPVDDDGAFTDIDTPVALERLLAAHRSAEQGGGTGVGQ
jgi:CTP:molybdopterin cytidylyltransferase MocA